jgi:hypothetical protein
VCIPSIQGLLKQKKQTKAKNKQKQKTSKRAASTMVIRAISPVDRAGSPPPLPNRARPSCVLRVFLHLAIGKNQVLHSRKQETGNGNNGNLSAKHIKGTDHPWDLARSC